MSNLKEVFTEIYNHNKWGSTESKSGIGSTHLFTINIRNSISQIINRYDVKDILDVSCGDWNWMKTISHKLPRYTGLDIVEKIVEENSKKFSNDRIRFVCSDFLSYVEKIEGKVDLILCRHTLEHLPEEYNMRFLDQCQTKCKLLLITTHDKCNKNEDLEENNTYRPINMELPPYDLIKQSMVDKIYDGPLSRHLEEMYICLYNMENKNENI